MPDHLAPLGADDVARLARLQAYGVLDTPREASFDRAVFTAAQIFRTPIAQLAFVDDTRQWAKASVGPFPDQVLREASMCALGLHSTEPLVVVDTSQEPRMRRNPFVLGPPYVQFYAGAPLITPDGLRVGALCVMDLRPRSVTARLLWTLQQLAGTVVDLLESRRTDNAGR